MKNKDPFAPWNREPFANDPLSPHNKGPNDMTKAWNQVFWKPEDLSMEERRFYKIDFEYYEFKKYFHEKSRQLPRSSSP